MAFKEDCHRAVDSVLNGNTFLIMPTGGGKTICYAVPALMKAKVTVVIFPLIALLLDQVERMRLQGLNVCYFMSDIEEADREIAKRKLQSNPPEYHFLFATPETVLAPALFNLLQKLSSENLINVFVIDEVYCIDSWGFHFRLLLSLSPYLSHLVLSFSVPISPCALLACCMKTTGDESGKTQQSFHLDLYFVDYEDECTFQASTGSLLVTDQQECTMAQRSHYIQMWSSEVKSEAES